MSEGSDYTVYRRCYEVVDNIDTLKPRRILRSSSPNYEELAGGNSDKTQRFDDFALKFLQDAKIKAVISLNYYAYDDNESFKKMEASGIRYLHLPVKDFDSPTIAQLEAGIAFIKTVPAGSILIHCGYGWGRTGTFVTALQLHCTKGKAPTEEWWKEGPQGKGGNHVERDNQMERLREWQKKIKSS